MWKVKDQIAMITNESKKQLTEEIFQTSFDAIQSLQHILEDKLWEHIYRCMELAQLDPAALVRALTIIEKNQGIFAKDFGVSSFTKSLQLE